MTPYRARTAAYEAAAEDEDDLQTAWFDHLTETSCKLSVVNAWRRAETDTDVWPAAQICSMFDRHAPELTHKFRVILVDWLYDVAKEYWLSDTCVPHAAAIFDAFLALELSASRARLQLVGVTSLWMVSKLHEYSPPTVRALAYITDGTSLTQDLRDMEALIGARLHWRLDIPTPHHYVSALAEVASELYPDNDSPTRCPAVRRFLKACVRVATVFGHALSAWLPSAIAAAVVFACRAKFHMTPVWSSSLVQLSGYGADNMPWECVDTLESLCNTTPECPDAAKFRHGTGFPQGLRALMFEALQ